jgi:hypothetical protein
MVYKRLVIPDGLHLQSYILISFKILISEFKINISFIDVQDLSPTSFLIETIDSVSSLYASPLIKLANIESLILFLQNTTFRIGL